MLSIPQLQAEVGPWSLQNFDEQRSKVHYLIKNFEGVELGWAYPVFGEFNPIRGISEEVGELFEAETKAAAMDSIGDIFIYTCDAASRIGLVLPHRIDTSLLAERDRNLDPGAGLVVCQGRLQHAYLKRDQGIRKAFQNTSFEEKRAYNLILILYYLDKYARDRFPGCTLLSIANDTWAGIVKKRDWKADPEAGGGHTHHDLEAPAEPVAADSLPAPGAPLAE